MDKSTAAEPRSGLRKRQRVFTVPLPSITARLTCISYRALGVHAFVLDQSEGWDVRAEQLANDGKRTDGTGRDGKPHLREGRAAIRKILWELAAAGLYRLERRQGPNGQFKMGTAISDLPIEAWAAQAAIFGDNPIPVVERADGTFLVRYPNGVLLPEDEMPPADLKRQPAKAKKERTPPRRGTQKTPPDQAEGSTVGTGVQSLDAGAPGSKKPASGKPTSGERSPLVSTSIRPDHKTNTDQPSVDQLGAAQTEDPPFEQPALDGSVPEQRQADAKEETPRQVALGIARKWVAFRAKNQRPVVMAGSHPDAPLHALAKLIEPWLRNNYTVDEVKHALNLANIGVPSQQHFEKAINEVRHGLSQSARARARPTVDVNAQWADVRPTDVRSTAGASAGRGSGW